MAVFNNTQKGKTPNQVYTTLAKGIPLRDPKRRRVLTNTISICRASSYSSSNHLRLLSYSHRQPNLNAPVTAWLECESNVHYRSLSSALYYCWLSFTLFRLLPSKGGCATTLCADLPSATSALWHFYTQCLFNSFRQVIWLECKINVSLQKLVNLVCASINLRALHDGSLAATPILACLPTCSTRSRLACFPLLSALSRTT